MKVVCFLMRYIETRYIIHYNLHKTYIINIYIKMCFNKRMKDNSLLSSIHLFTYNNYLFL